MSTNYAVKDLGLSLTFEQSRDFILHLLSQYTFNTKCCLSLFFSYFGFLFSTWDLKLFLVQTVAKIKDLTFSEEYTFLCICL